MARRKCKQQFDTATAFTGDGSNIRHRGGNAVGQQWWAFNGDPLMSIKPGHPQGRWVTVGVAVCDLQDGKYGTQTPVSMDYIAMVCPGLAS